MESTIYTVDGREFELQHYGVKGMKWGVRKKYKSGDRMDTNDKSDSKTTRRVKNDYNTMSDIEFRKKYQTSKETYRKRVNRYGDPYMNSPLAKMGKHLSKSKTLNKIANSKSQQKRADKLRDKLTGQNDSVNAAKVATKVAIAGAVGTAALAGVISAIGRKTPSQATNYANVGRTVINTISIPTIPIPTVPVGRTTW